MPTPGVAPEPGALGRAGKWFPAVGLILGLILAIMAALFHGLFPPLLAAGLTVALWIALTGGLHLDGLADCCDGLLASVPSERRLEIMRDPRLGAFGGIGLAMALLLKVLAVAALPAGATALLLAPTLARWMLLPIARQPSARPGGMGAGFAAGLTPAILLVSTPLPLALMILGGSRALFALLAAGAVTLGIIHLARTKLGGVTGDVFGLTIELVELSVLLVYAAK